MTDSTVSPEQLAERASRVDPVGHRYAVAVIPSRAGADPAFPTPEPSIHGPFLTSDLAFAHVYRLLTLGVRADQLVVCALTTLDPMPGRDDIGAMARLGRAALAEAKAGGRAMAAPARDDTEPAAEPVARFYTFGVGHKHPVTGEPLRRRYVKIYGPTAEHCRAEMLNRFGRGWSSEYVDASALPLSASRLEESEWPEPSGWYTVGPNGGVVQRQEALRSE